MFERGPGDYFEMRRYEEYMDNLRAVALWIANHNGHSLEEFGFAVIKDHSRKFAADIIEWAQIPPPSLHT